MQTIWIYVLSFGIFLLGAAKAWGGPGDLDPTWDGDGWTVAAAANSRGDIANALTIQPDGKVVAGGLATTPAGGLDFYLARFLPNGELDPSFGDRGQVLTDFPPGLSNSADFIQDLIIQEDGKILAVGGTVFSANMPISQSPPTNGDINFALARYLPDGSLDPSFGTDGLVSWDFSGINAIDQINAVQIDSRGRILVAGSVAGARGRAQHDFAVARLLPDGSLDLSFGTQGQTRTDLISASDDLAHDLVLDPQGRILLAGETTPVVINPSADFAVVRYTEDGVLDPSFGTSGIVRVNFAANPTQAGLLSDDRARAMAFLPDGRIRLAGEKFQEHPIRSDVALFGLTKDGAVDVSFGEQGLLTLEFPDHFSAAQDLIVSRDGKLWVAGNAIGSANFNSSSWTLARLHEDGSPDMEFGREGRLLPSFPEFNAGFSGANALVEQADGKILAAGYSQIGRSGGNQILAMSLARFQVSESQESLPEPTPEQGSETPLAPRVELELSGGGCSLTTEFPNKSADPIIVFYFIVIASLLYCNRAPH